MDFVAIKVCQCEDSFSIVMLTVEGEGILRALLTIECFWHSLTIIRERFESTFAPR